MVEVICGVRSPLFHVVISYSSNKFRCVSWQLKSANINDVNNGLQLLCIAILSAHISENIDCMYSVVRDSTSAPKCLCQKSLLPIRHSAWNMLWCHDDSGLLGASSYIDYLFDENIWQKQVKGGRVHIISWFHKFSFSRAREKKAKEAAICGGRTIN